VKEEFEVESEECYNFAEEVTPPSITEEEDILVANEEAVIVVEPEEEECAASPSNVYRYPFTNPGAGCPVDTEEDETAE